MNCPVGGEAAAQLVNPCIAADAAVLSENESTGSDFELNGDSWRQEVAARLQRYRTRRRPRPPRYPSLRLPFDSFEPTPSVASAHGSGALAATRLAPEPTLDAEDELNQPVSSPALNLVSADAPELFSNVIEFPRSAIVPIIHSNALAEPVLDRPRIVEAPEVLPPPPAMGGILMDPVSSREPESKQVSRMPFAPASIESRVLAGLMDGVILTAALAAFGGMSYWLNSYLPARPVMIIGGLITLAVFWACYQFLFLVYSAGTPGMRLAHLRLTNFDGSPVSRSRRRWRVLASYLSALSLGLGYLWGLLDEDALCWHDRMTHTLPMAGDGSPSTRSTV